MHIGLCSPQWPPSEAANGIVTYVSCMRDYFLSQGHAVSVIAQGRLATASGEVHRLAPAPKCSIPPSWHARLTRRTGTWRGSLPDVGQGVANQVIAARLVASLDIVEIEESFGWSEIVQRGAGIPVVTRLHGPHFLKPKRQRTARQWLSDVERSAAEGRAIKSARALTAPSRAVMSAVCRRYRLESDPRHAVIPNPIAIAREQDRWQPAACEPGHILMVGRFDFWKGADTMLAAFARLLDRRPEARLTLVGPDLGMEAPNGSILSFAQYAQTHLSPAARERITFTGTLNPEQIGQLRRRACVTVLASRLENFPYALLEGLAVGSPVISTDWPGSEEIIVHRETGLLTPVGEPEPLARSLDWLIGRPETAARYAISGLARCRQHFSVETVGNQMLQFYEAALRTAAR